MKIYAVGGAVRDVLLHREPKDHDWVIVGATAPDVAALVAAGYSQVGADFPVFLHPKTGEEYALARVERKTGTGYLGFTVQADELVTLEEDLGRRDLTINSMARAEDGTIIDPYHGLHDLHNHILRHTSAAFSEDPLRVLRLARFAARFKDFTVAKDTIELCKTIAESKELDALSIERVWVELEKGFGEDYPDRFFKILSDVGALRGCTILSELFGTVESYRQGKICKALAGVSPAARLAVSVSTLTIGAHPAKHFRGINRRVADCYENVVALRNSEYTVQSFQTVLKNAGAMRSGTNFDDFIEAAIVLEQAGELKTFTPRQLSTGAKIMQAVKSTQFPSLTGKALGQAMDEQRKQDLQLGTGIP